MSKIVYFFQYAYLMHREMVFGTKFTYVRNVCAITLPHIFPKNIYLWIGCRKELQSSPRFQCIIGKKEITIFISILYGFQLGYYFMEDTKHINK